MNQMKPWVVEGESILDRDVLAKDLQKKSFKDHFKIVPNASIKTFLNQFDTKLIIAPKGFGKSVLHIKKRLQYHAMSVV
ncbi:hypothetical protein EH221_04805 [bacterium]|nr:MAG: hypothetical protein EH221_04805 [bacterium]